MTNPEIHRVRNDPPPAALIQALHSCASPVIAGHVTPDVDALASMLGLARLLACSKAQIALPLVPSSHKLRFMLELAGEPAIANAQRVKAADALVTVDTASTKRVNVEGKWEAVA